MENVKIIEILEDGEKKYCTEGLNKYIKKELRINICLEKDLAEYILSKLSEKIINGKKYKDNSYDNTILNCKIYFIYKEDFIIVVFPDIRMKYPWDEDCQEFYKNQI